MIVSMFLCWLYCAFEIFVTWKRLNHDGEYRLEIPANFHFYGPEKTINLAENKITKIEENLNETMVKCIQIFY